MSKKRLIIFTIINGVMLLLLALVIIRSAQLKGLLQSQLAAERFSGQSGERFAQITVLYPNDSGITYEQIRAFRDSLEGKLTQASLEAPENGSLWIDAYSMKSKLQVKGFRGSSSATAIGVGGDYFSFHPLRLRSGNYISDSDLMKDMVVLNEELAWQLFGSYDVAGMEITIDGIPYLIAGVVEREKDFASNKAHTDGASIYVSYQTLLDAEDASFSCYEIVLPNPVSNFAKGIVTEKFSQTDIQIIQNTGRYSISKTWSLIKNFGDRSIQNNGIAYPYWENAARIVEDNLALMFVFAVLLSIFPFACLMIIIVRLYKKINAKKKYAFEWIDRKREKISQQLRRKKRT